MPESDDKDLQPTFGGCHGETLPESERVGSRRATRFRKYGQVRCQADIDKQEDDQWWKNAERRGAKDAYEQSKRPV
jgi:hypothetical protein